MNPHRARSTVLFGATSLLAPRRRAHLPTPVATGVAGVGTVMRTRRANNTDGASFYLVASKTFTFQINIDTNND
jgi:hypothetical protein